MTGIKNNQSTLEQIRKLLRFHLADKIDRISDESECIEMNFTLSETLKLK